METTKEADNPLLADYRVGIRGIDDDHAVLIGLAGALKDYHARGAAHEIVAPALTRLVSYVQLHFSREERLMRAHRYPDAEAHVKQHASFAEKIAEFEEAYRRHDTGLAAEVVLFLKNWIVNHIVGVDRELAVYLKERGVN